MARSLRATVQLKLRMKEPLRAVLEKAAVKRGVSLNAETVHRLERSFWADELAGLERRVENLEDLALSRRLPRSLGPVLPKSERHPNLGIPLLPEIIY